MFVLGDKGMGLFLAGNQLYKVTEGLLEKLVSVHCHYPQWGFNAFFPFFLNVKLVLYRILIWPDTF